MTDTDAQTVDTAAPAEPEPDAADTEVQERPDWLPAQFLTPEALAASYAESVRKITSQGQQLAELSRENELLTAEIERLVASREELEARISGLERTFVSRIAGVLR